MVNKKDDRRLIITFTWLWLESEKEMYHRKQIYLMYHHRVTFHLKIKQQRKDILCQGLQPRISSQHYDCQMSLHYKCWYNPQRFVCFRIKTTFFIELYFWCLFESTNLQKLNFLIKIQRVCLNILFQVDFCLYLCLSI